MARRRKPMAELNVVPYIDVMLVLLIIFMVTAPMLQTGVEIQLPETDAETITSEDQKEPLLVSIDADGSLYLDDKRMQSAQELKTVLQGKIAAEGTLSLHVRGDRNTSYNDIMKAVVAAQTAGVKKIGLISDPPQNP